MEDFRDLRFNSRQEFEDFLAKINTEKELQSFAYALIDTIAYLEHALETAIHLSETGHEDLNITWYRKTNYALKANRINLESVEKKLAKVKEGNDPVKVLEGFRRMLGDKSYHEMSEQIRKNLRLEAGK